MNYTIYEPSFCSHFATTILQVFLKAISTIEKSIFLQVQNLGK